MKKLIAVMIAVIVAFYVSYAAAADYGIEVPQYSPRDKGHWKTQILIKTICIDGYKFLVTYLPADVPYSSGIVSTIQMYQHIDSTASAVPMRCPK